MSEKNFYEELGSRIRDKREKKGYKTINQICLELAEYGLDISESMFGKYELGTQKISVFRLAVVAKVLDCDVSELIPEIEAC